MSKLALKQIAEEIAKTATNKANEKAGTAARVINEQNPFHVVTLDKDRIIDAYRTLFPSSAGNDLEAEQAYEDVYDFLIGEYKKKDKAAEKKIGTFTAKQKKADKAYRHPIDMLLDQLVEIRNTRRSQGRDSFIGPAFNTIGRVKGSTLKKYMKGHKFFKSFNDPKLIASVGGHTQPGMEGHFGTQLEHGGESISGLPASAVRARLAEQSLEKFGAGLSGADFKKVKQQINEALKVTNTLDRHLDVSADGKTLLNYAQEVVLTSAVHNQEGAPAEVEAGALLDAIGDIVVAPGSDSLLDGISATQTYNVAGKPSRRKKVTGRKARQVKSKTKATASKNTRTKIPITPEISVMGASAELKQFAKATKRRKGQTGKGDTHSGMSLNSLGVFNEKISRFVRRNMKDPALENRTGRFADSVQVVDLTRTAKGFPSVGYTYDRRNYGQYESTSGSRYASADRDPRVIIDKSIREIAAGMAIGRFFTRRV